MSTGPKTGVVPYAQTTGPVSSQVIYKPHPMYRGIQVILIKEKLVSLHEVTADIPNIKELFRQNSTSTFVTKSFGLLWESSLKTKSTRDSTLVNVFPKSARVGSSFRHSRRTCGLPKVGRRNEIQGGRGRKA